MGALSNLYVEFSASSKKFHEAMSDISRSAREVDKVLKPIKDRAADIGKGLTAGFTLPVLGMGAAAVASAIKIDDALDSIRVSTGVTGNALESLNKDFKTVFKAVPSSAEDASRAIGELNKRTGLVGQPLQELSKQTLNLARLTKVGLQETIESTTRVFGDWSISTDKQSASLDFLFKVGQQTGIGVDKLSRSVVQFGAPLRQMGFDFETSAALLGKFEKEGVNGELVMSSLRIALTKMAKVGIVDAKAGLEEITRQIQNAGTASQANAIAVGAFGAKAGPDMAAAVREGRFAISELLQSIQKSPETINAAAKATDGFKEKLEILRNKATLALEPVGIKLIEAMERIVPTAERALGKVADLADSFSKMSPGAQDATLAIIGFTAVLGPALTLIVKMSSTLVGLYALFSKVALSIGGLSGAISAVPLLLAVKNYGDLSAAISLIGGTSVAATAGLVAIAAAVGVAIGLFANWILKITGLQESFDRLLKSTVEYIPVIGKWITGQSQVDAATAQTTKSVQAMVDELGKYNIAVDMSRINEAGYLVSLTKKRLEQINATKSTVDHATSIVTVGTAAKEAGNEIDKINGLLQGNTDAAKKAADANAKLSFAFRGIEKDLKAPISRFAFNLDALGEKATIATPKLKAMVGPVIPQIEMLDFAMQALRHTTDETANASANLFVAREKDAKVAKEALEKIKADYDKTFSSIKSTAVRSWSDIIQDGQLQFNKLGGIIKGIFRTLAVDLLSTMTASFLTPLVQNVTKLFTGSNGLLSKLPGVSGLLTKFGVGGAGGALTYGPTLAQLGIGGTAAGTAAGAGAGAGGAGSAIAAFATNPVTIAAAGAIAAGIAIKTFVGRGRRTANEFVQGTENPFGRNLSALVDSFDSASKAGTLTLDSAEEARAALTELWSSFNASAADFARRGRREATVVEQAYDNLAKKFGGPNLANIFADFDSAIAQLKNPAVNPDAASAAAGAGIPQTGKATSASEIFARAVDRFVKGVDSGATAGNSIQVDMDFTLAPVFQMANGEVIDAETVRTKIMPEITDVLETGIRGFREKWAGLLQNGLVTSTVPTT